MLINSANCKNSNILFGILMALALLASPTFSLAQQDDVAPPQQELTPTQTDIKPALAAQPEMTEVDAEEGAIAAKADPCPLPATEMAKTPDDLAKIQSDIDRYTLCMERASLLQRLNDVAMENQKKLQQSNGVSADNPGMNLDNLPDFDEQKRAVENAIDAPPVLVMQEKEAPSSNEWLIVKVSGSASDLSAQLGKSDGTLTNVKAGDELPDGASVNSVSATSVSITQDGAKKTLKWLDNSSKKENRL